MMHAEHPLLLRFIRPDTTRYRLFMDMDLDPGMDPYIINNRPCLARGM